MAVLNNKRYTVLRYTRQNVDGVVVETSDDEFVVTGNLQPASERTLQLFDEGFRTAPGQKWVLYTGPAVDLRLGGIDREEGSNHEPDRIVIDDTGRLAYCHSLKDWKEGLIPGRYYGFVEAETESGAFTDV